MKTQKKKRGLGLIEVMVSIFILGIAFMSFAPALLFSQLTVEKSKYTEIASQSAHAELEKWRETPFDQLPLVAGKSSVLVPLAQPSGLPKGKGHVKLTSVDEKLHATAVKGERVLAEVTVTWEASARNKGTVTMHTLLSSKSEDAS